MHAMSRFRRRGIYACIFLACGFLVLSLIGMVLPQAHVASRSVHFKAPPQKIWDIITGPPTWRPDVRSFETLPAREGRPMWKEVDKHGRAITFERVEAQSPHRLITRIAESNLPFAGTW